MIKIRLTRVGGKSDPHYRIIVVPTRSKRDTKAIEIIGFYNPKTKALNVDKERLSYWKAQGSQLTDVIKRLLGESNPKVQKTTQLKKQEVKEPQKAEKEKKTAEKNDVQTESLKDQK